MVGPGEVDEDLEPEVKEEMMKYGDVVSVVIFEVISSCGLIEGVFVLLSVKCSLRCQVSRKKRLYEYLWNFLKWITL